MVRREPKGTIEPNQGGLLTFLSAASGGGSARCDQCAVHAGGVSSGSIASHRAVRNAPGMSAMPLIATQSVRRNEASQCAISRHMLCGKPAPLFDHLVSAQEEISTDRQSERSRCFEIDDKLEFGGLLNRQVGRLRAFQNLVDISGGAQEQIGKAWAI